MLVALLGLLIRLDALLREPINSDQAVVGLMADQILHGHFAAFYWGQAYGGGEPYAVALVFRLAGSSPFTLGLTPVILDAVAALLAYCIGRRLFSVRAGQLAALLMWIWPAAVLVQSTVEYGFRFAALDLGLGAFVVALRIAAVASDEPGPDTRLRRTLDSGLLGLLLGLGWWCTPEIAYFAVPIAIVLGYRLVRRRLHLGLADAAAFVGAAILGALPWIWANVNSGLASLRSGVQPNPSPLEHLRVFVAHALPIALGLQFTVSGHFIGGVTVGGFLELVAICAVLLVAVSFLLDKRHAMLVWFLATFPVIYAISPFTWFWADGRYVCYLPPMIAVVIGGLVEEVGRLRRAPRRLVAHPMTIGLVAVVVLGALTADAVVHESPFRPDHVAGTARVSWTSLSSDPNSFDANLADSLRRLGISDVYAGYWVAYPLAFVSHSSVLASDVRYDRSPSLLAEIEASPDPAWLFADPDRPLLRRVVTITGSSLLDPNCAVENERCLTPARFEAVLSTLKVGYRTVVVGSTGFEAILPARKVDPHEILVDAGLIPA